MSRPLLPACLLALGLAACGAGGGAPVDAADAGADRPDAAAIGDAVPEAPEVPPDAGDVPEDAADADAGPPPLYRIDGRFLRDREGRALLFRGIAIATGDLERWAKDAPGSDAAAFRQIADGGFNAIRLAINWDRIEPEAGVVRRDYVDLVASHVRLAAAEGLYVFVDMHQDLYGTGFGSHGAPDWSCDAAWYAAFKPIEPWFLNYFSAPVSACFDHFWKTPEIRRHQQEAARAVAEAIADVELVAGFDPHNEPFPGTTAFDDFDRDLLMPYYAEFAAVVLPALPGRVLFLEPAVTFSPLYHSALPGPLTAFPGVFAPHYYNGQVETQKLWGGAMDDLVAAVDGAQAVADRLAIPLVYGELGGDKTTPDLTEYLLALYGLLDGHWAGSTLWIFSKGDSGFGAVGADGTWSPNAPAFLRPAPSAVAGTPGALSWDLAARTLDFAWTADGSGTTEFLLPGWVKAAGYACTLDGAPVEPALDPAGRRLRLPALAPGPHAFRLGVAKPYGER